MNSTFDKPVIFVGGAPRSGTTITHALLCTSDRTNDYCPETSFLKPLFSAFRLGMSDWKKTSKFYAGKPAFTARMRGCVQSALDDISRALGEPEVLSIKDPLLTPQFFWVHRLLGKQVKFVTVVRTPTDIVRSRQEVFERAGQTMTEAKARAVAAEINASYTYLDVEDMKDALFVLRYEDLARPETLEGLRSFTGLTDIDPEKVWGEKQLDTKAAERSGGDWFSPKYNRPISLEKRFDPLDPKLAKIVNEVCAPLIERFGYGAAVPQDAASAEEQAQPATEKHVPPTMEERVQPAADEHVQPGTTRAEQGRRGWLRMPAFLGGER